MKHIKWVFATVAALASLPSFATVRVLACEPEWGALARELGGNLLDVSVATSALQDPHQIQAKPSLIAKARSADMVVCTGAELEVGWLPLLLQQSGNRKVQPGQPGNFAAADFVHKLDVPTQLDRGQGDVHAAGNPHIQTDPETLPRWPLRWRIDCKRWTLPTQRNTRSDWQTLPSDGSKPLINGPHRRHLFAVFRWCPNTRDMCTFITGWV